MTTQKDSQEFVQTLVDTVHQEIIQLYKWADESERGGWSTHQVQPMRDRASKLQQMLVRFGIGV